MTLQELLESQGMGDGLEIDIGGNKFTLGDVRKIRKERQDSVEKEIRMAEAKRSEAEKSALEAATLLAQLQEATKAAPKNAASKTDAYDWKSDPLFAPMVAYYDEKLTAALKVAEQSAKDAQDLRKSLNETASVYAYERMQNEYERAPESFRKKVKFEDIAKEVIAAKEVDRFGLPTISRRIKETIEPDLREEYAKEKIAEARKQWESEQAAAAARPAGGARFSNRKDAAPPVKRIEEITSEMVAADPDVQAAMRREVQ